VIDLPTKPRKKRQATMWEKSWQSYRTMKLQHVNRRSEVGSPHTAVKAETNPHVTVTKARYSRGAGTVFMIKFEGTCI